MPTQPNFQSALDGIDYGEDPGSRVQPSGLYVKSGYAPVSVSSMQLGIAFGWKDTSNQVVAQYQIAEELVAIAITSVTTDSAGFMLPANSLIMAVTYRVMVTPGASPTFSIGDATTAARFKAAGLSSAATQTGVGLDHWNPAGAAVANGPSQAAAAKVRFTFNSGPSDALGQIKVRVLVLTFAAPSS